MTRDAAPAGRPDLPAFPAFLAGIARWVNAESARFVPVDATDPPADAADAPYAAAAAWLVGVREADQGEQIVAEQRLEFAAVRDRAGVLRGALLVQRPLRRPRPAGQRERIALAASLTASLLDVLGAAEFVPDGDDRDATGRRRLADWIEAAHRAGRRASVFVVGIDRLAVVNEVSGRFAGDEILAALRSRLADWGGTDGFVVRLSGSRFALVRADLGPGASVAAATELRDVLAAPVRVADLPISRSVSIGVAAADTDEVDPDELVRGAVRSSLAARESGGDEVREYHGELAASRLGRLRLELELDEALRAGQLRLYYQPEFDLRTGALLAVEALLRWQHPRLGLIRADEFVGDTERTRTFAAVQNWVADEACRQLGTWQATPRGRELALRINVSARQIGRGHFVADLLTNLERVGIDPRTVCVELTERRMPRSTADIGGPLERLRARGVSIAIDDFGTGQGTVSQLITLPVDTIKIDQSFVSAMRTDPRAEAVVAGIISLATSLSLDTVAEGVDGADTAARLVQLGCTRGQGNTLGEAMPATQLDQLLRG